MLRAVGKCLKYVTGGWVVWGSDVSSRPLLGSPSPPPHPLFSPLFPLPPSLPSSPLYSPSPPSLPPSAPRYLHSSSPIPCFFPLFACSWFTLLLFPPPFPCFHSIPHSVCHPFSLSLSYSLFLSPSLPFFPPIPFTTLLLLSSSLFLPHSLTPSPFPLPFPVLPSFFQLFFYLFSFHFTMWCTWAYLIQNKCFWNSIKISIKETRKKREKTKNICNYLYFLVMINARRLLFLRYYNRYNISIQNTLCLQ